MQLVHPRRNVNYRRVIDALADSIAELNSVKAEGVAPAAPSVLAVPRDFDVDAFVDELLRTLDQRAAESGTGRLGDAAADAAAEHSASSQEFVALPAFIGALNTALAIAGFVTSTYQVYEIFKKFQSRRRGK
jgi:hypothetical protein